MTLLTAYLDTCILSGLARQDLKAEELSALLQILKARKRGIVLLVTSEVAKGEIDKVPENYRLKHEIIYNLLSDVPVAKAFLIYGGSMSLSMSMSLGGQKKLHLLFAKLTELLPDESDAHHLYQAARNDVQYFLTTDVRTILSYREKIDKISGVKAVSPQEFTNILTEVGVTDA